MLKVHVFGMTELRVWQVYVFRFGAAGGLILLWLSFKLYVPGVRVILLNCGITIVIKFFWKVNTIFMYMVEKKY